MMASQKNNYVVNYFTLDISDIIAQSQNTNQSSITCEYEILTDNPGNMEILSSDVIDAKLIDNVNIEENNNSSCDRKIHTMESLVEPKEHSENDGETSCQEVSSDDDDGDDLEDLTNLNWLTELKNITNIPPTTNEIQEKPCDPPSQRFDKFMSQVIKIKESYEKRCELYRHSSSEKPPYNYAQIIAMAMLDEGRMTLKQICDWIENRFAYYRIHRNWNVS
jgi:Forkhead domain